MTDDGDIILTEPDNMQVEEKLFTRISEGAVALPPEENMEVIKTKNIVLKRKNPNNEIAKVKKRKNDTDVLVRDVVPIQHPIYRRLEKNLHKGKKEANKNKNNSMALVRLKTEDETAASVDISTIERLLWVDFNTILDNAECNKRAEVILNILQNNLPPSENDIYYIYHDPKTNTYSIEVDADSAEIQDFIESILVIDAKLKVEDLSAKERAQLKNLKKMKIKIIRKKYGSKELADVLGNKLTEEEKRRAENEIIKIQEQLNQENNEYYYVFNDETEEFELRKEHAGSQIIHKIVAAILKLDKKYKDSSSRSERKKISDIKNAFIQYLRRVGTFTLADSLK